MEMKRLHRSRALREVGYDPATSTLRIHFDHGGLYDYQRVPAKIFHGLLESEHPWTDWGDHIKAYPFRRLR